jgi:hypothetical protein
LNKIQTKVLRVFLLAIHNRLYSFALRFLFLQIYATSHSFYSSLLYTVKEKGEKPDRNLKPDNFQDYAQKPQRNCTFMNLDSGLPLFLIIWLSTSGFHIHLDLILRGNSFRSRSGLKSDLHCKDKMPKI